MALVSMTGFADAQGAREGVRWRWEAKSVNGRGLDLRLRLPPGLDSVVKFKDGEAHAAPAELLAIAVK